MKTDWGSNEPFRITQPPFASSEGDTFGMFMFIFGAKLIRVIACDGQETGWEHVSVSCCIGRKEKTPSWGEMHFVKQRFWDDEETVIQFHPPASEYVNNHKHCLHLWKCVATPFPLPPSELVGVKRLDIV